MDKLNNTHDVRKSWQLFHWQGTDHWVTQSCLGTVSILRYRLILTDLICMGNYMLKKRRRMSFRQNLLSSTFSCPYNYDAFILKQAFGFIYLKKPRGSTADPMNPLMIQANADLHDSLCTATTHTTIYG